MRRTGLLWLLCAILAAGCSQKPAASHLATLPEEPVVDLQLSPAEQREALSAMKSVAEGHDPAPGSKVSVQGMRWSDLEAAVAMACDAEGVELVIIDVEKTDERKFFTLRTADDRPATLDVRRTHDGRLYEASATVGRFNRANDQERAALLIEEIERAMAQYAKKRRLPEVDS